MTPQPVPTRIECSECGLAWDRHLAKLTESPTGGDAGHGVTLAICIELLEEDLAAKPIPTPVLPYRPPGTWDQQIID